MILQALCQLYGDLVSRGEISPPGWSPCKVGHALCLDSGGNVTQIVPLTDVTEKGDKKTQVNRTMILPAAVKRTVGVAPNFLFDNSGYIFGVDGKGKPKRSRECFDACAKLHNKLLDGIDAEEARAIKAFFEKWDPERSDENEAFASAKEELLKGGNIVFRINGVFAQDVPEIARVWQDHYDGAEGERIRCLVTGEEDALESVHPAIKGVIGAQSSGAAIVSFNAPAFSSFGKLQGANAPVGKKAAFAYTAALNRLLADRENVAHIGDATVVCWAKGGAPQYRGFSRAALFGGDVPEGMTQDDLRASVKRLADGLPCKEFGLEPGTEFYILGLSPNAARLSVRFFLCSSFGELMKNVNAHHERLEIKGQKYPLTPLWALLKETVNPNSKDKSPSPVLAGSAARAVFSGSPYPAALMEATQLRIRAERDITPGKAAIIKAYYLKNENPKCPKEVLQVSLNENSANAPYVMGRLFAVYESVQQSANPGINATVRDKYFNSAAATPAVVFSVMNNLYQKHLRKLDAGLRVYYEKQVGELMGVLGETLPARLSLPEQASFQLGYYHQKQKRFEKKK